MFVAVLILSCLAQALAEGSPPTVCQNKERFGYMGTVNVTKNGLPCQRWDQHTPTHHVYKYPEQFPDATISEAENYCRNLGAGAAGVWCFTMDPNVEWDRCDVPDCSKVTVDCTGAAGYEGINCETNTDDCSPAPCINDGVCRNGEDSYTCACALGYKGTTCETSGFIQHRGKHISWGTPQDPSVTSVAACADLCRQDVKCGFFDFNYGYIGDTYEGPYHGAACWLHDESKTAKDLIDAEMDVDSYEKKKEEEEE